MEKLNAPELLEKLKKKGQRNADYTRAVIKEKLGDTDNEIATTSCKVSLACPLGNKLASSLISNDSLFDLDIYFLNLSKHFMAENYIQRPHLRFRSIIY